MLLVAVFVLTNTVSADGSIGGVYQASLRLAEQSAGNGPSGGLKELTNGLRELVQGQKSEKPATTDKPASEKKGDQKSGQGANGSGKNGR
jgi:hypothetical protein